MKFTRFFFTVFVMMVFLFIASSLGAAEKALTIIHTNDLHSRLLGFSPNIDYTPEITGDDATSGGWARIATVIETVKKARSNPVIVLDAGDFLMGSLFHMVCRDEALELRLMKEMGFDVTTLGNHEFDLRPEGLARIVMTAAQNDRMPALVASNVVFDKEDKRDDSLEAVFVKQIIKPYIVLKREGLRIGVFGLMGLDAAEKSPFASPVKFADPIETSRRIVKRLQEIEKADLIVCLSHSGLSEDREKSEDVILARQVEGIDIIISGHSHTRLEEPILAGNTIIVQTGAYGKFVGVLDVFLEGGTIRRKKYELVPIDDQVKAADWVNRRIESFVDIVNQQVLAAEGLSFFQVVAETGFDLTIKEEESNLGNLIADSIRWYINKTENIKETSSPRVNVAVESNGLIRSPVLKGKTGKIAVCDLFRAIPLGVGFDEGSMAYPLVTFYIYGSELKKALEILTTIAPIKGDDYYLQISGVKFKYNPYRMLFDRVTDIWLEDEDGEYKPLDYSKSNKTLYRVAANIYNSVFLEIVGDFTYGILNIQPKDKDGQPIADLVEARVDADQEKEGVQGLKEWKGVMEYVKTFKDIDGNGIPDVPERYRHQQGRIVKAASLNPASLLVRASYVTWAALAAVVIVIVFLAFIVYTALILIKKGGVRTRKAE